jgi:hypothetical protein
MSDAFDAIFDNKQAEVPAIQPPETPPIEAPAAVEEATMAPAAEVQTEAPQVEPAPQERVDKNVPLAALLDERDKRKALEAELAAIRAKAPVDQPAIPDPYDDPDGYNAFITNTVQQQTLAVKIDISEEMAKTAHGEEAVEAAKEWAIEHAAANPAFKQQFFGARHPMDWVVRQHQQARDLELYQKDPLAFARTILERNGQPPVTDAMPGAVSGMGQQPPAIPLRPAPPRSIASAPSGGGSAREVATGPLAAVDSLFTR